MKQSRLNSLADGIFAIVMTILVFEIRVPELYGIISDRTLLKALTELYPALLSFLLSFSLLFTYWRSHHFIASVLAKNIDTRFSNLNGIFFFFVALVPFTSHFLSRYTYSKVAIIMFAVNIILIGISLFRMRRHVIKARTIENTPFTKTENEHANMHIFFPIIAAVAAIAVSFYSAGIAILLFTLAILFNLLKRSNRIVFSIIDIFRKKEEEEIEIKEIKE